MSTHIGKGSFLCLTSQEDRNHADQTDPGVLTNNLRKWECIPLSPVGRGLREWGKVSPSCSGVASPDAS